MRLARFFHAGGMPVVLGLVLLAPSGGCGDESKTTGTQLQLTPEDKAAIQDMRGAMKADRAAQIKERAEDRKKRR